MKKVVIALTVLALALCVAGCMSPEEKETQNQILGYIDTMNTIDEEQTALVNNIMVIENSDSDVEILQILSDEVIPAAESVSEKLSAVDTGNQEIAAVHQYFLDGWGQLTEGLNNLKTGLQESDLATAEEGGTQVTASQETLNQYYEELTALCEKYKIELEAEIETEVSEEIELEE